MIYNKIIQIRMSEELLAFCKTRPNVSLFIRSLIRYAKNKKSKKEGLIEVSSEIKARSPYIFFAELVKVVDGDTVILNADLGFNIQTKITARLAGIDVPETGSPGSEQTRKFVETRLTKNNLIVESRTKDKYGRYLVYIYYHRSATKFEDILRSGRVINEELIKNGLAKEYKD